MSYQALYRRFRSKTFDEIIGQEHVINTLKNQILTNNIAHAYLFCGIRGTGKTSTAKILARAVNCLNNVDGNPCNKCDICKSILDESNLDVIEMDAASNNSVDDIRDLRDKVKFMPSISKYKVYIIDEVHMLSKGAFNALLKTLEEPPEHLVFILATTEPQKIPATILSRCQRFDLKRISINNIVNNLKSICDTLDIKIEDKAIELIASSADGAMRDAQSILDRCITFNTDEIRYDDVSELLGIVSFNNINKLCINIINREIMQTMNLIDKELSSGKDIMLLIEQILTHFRNLLVYKTTGLIDNLLKISQEDVEIIKDYNNKINEEQLIYYIQSFSFLLSECKKSVNPRILLETRLISIMISDGIELKSSCVVNDSNINNINNASDSNNCDDIDKLLERIEKLEYIIKNKYNNINNTNNIRYNKNKVKLAASNSTNSNNQAKRSSLQSDAKQILSKDWNKFLQMLKRDNKGLYALIREAKFLEVNDNTIYLQYDAKFHFHYSTANQESNINKINNIMSEFLNSKCTVKILIREDNNIDENIKSIDDIYEDMKSAFGDDKVELK